MTNNDIKRIALQQSAYDFSCKAEDFVSENNVVLPSRTNERARKYLPLPFELDMASYGSNVVAQTSERCRDVARRYLDMYPAEHCFETPNIHMLDDMLAEYRLKVCFMAEYFLPDLRFFTVPECGYPLRILRQPDFAELYLPEWSNALCEKRKELDVLAVGAYDGDRLIGLAGCSADCETMYQIGVDVLPEYRRRGIASALTGRLAAEIFALDKVPFYCAAWCNIKSVRNAIGVGFRPAWVELTARDIEFVEQMNRVW